jgi:hypothetical protein
MDVIAGGGQHLSWSVVRTYSGRVVDNPEAIHMDEKSAFRPCGRDLREFFKSTGWAFPVKLIGDEGKRCAAYRLLFARRFAKRALSSRRRAVREGSDCDARTSVSQRVLCATTPELH